MFVIVGEVTFLGSDDETTNLYLQDPTIQWRDKTNSLS